MRYSSRRGREIMSVILSILNFRLSLLINSILPQKYTKKLSMSMLIWVYK
jgi:hypothetical protein